MEARVLRAALSAAIRVTVSTTLIGCGGRVGTDFPDPEGPQAPTTTDASQGNHGSGGTYASSPDHATPSAGTYGTPSAQAGQPQVSQGGTGMAVATGGAPSEEAGAAGSPEAVCGGQKTQLCLAHMESIEEFLIEPEDKVALDCCQTVLNPIPFIAVEPGCENELIPRLEAQRYRCCRVLDTFEGGCSPWGPPVPPELSGALLQTWLRVAA